MDGSPSSYIVTYSDYTTGSVCSTYTVLASSCQKDMCSIETEIVPPCFLSKDIYVVLSSVNIFGRGPPSEPVILNLISYESNESGIIILIVIFTNNLL